MFVHMRCTWEAAHCCRVALLIWRSQRIVLLHLNAVNRIQGLRWEAQPPRPGMTDTYLRFMNAAYKINPSEHLGAVLSSCLTPLC